MFESDAQPVGYPFHWELRSVFGPLDVTFKEDDCRVRTGHAPKTWPYCDEFCLHFKSRTVFQRSTRTQSSLWIILYAQDSCCLFTPPSNLTMTLNPLRQ